MMKMLTYANKIAAAAFSRQSQSAHKKKIKKIKTAKKSIC